MINFYRGLIIITQFHTNFSVRHVAFIMLLADLSKNQLIKTTRDKFKDLIMMWGVRESFYYREDRRSKNKHCTILFSYYFSLHHRIYGSIYCLKSKATHKNWIMSIKLEMIFMLCERDDSSELHSACALDFHFQCAF